MKKGDILSSIQVESMAAEGKCLSRLEDGRVLFIEGAAPGDMVDVQVHRIKSNFVEGKAVAILSLSASRTTPFCTHFGLCGGCKWQHLQYEKQLEYKQHQVVDNLQRIGGLSITGIKSILASAQTTHYRNKLDFTFSAQRWLSSSELAAHKAQSSEPIPLEPALGYHLPTFYDKVFDVSECHLQPHPSNALRLLVKNVAIENDITFFDLRKQIGYLRTLTIRTASTGEVMVILQVTYDQPEWLEKILRAIADSFPEVTSLQYVINGKRNDTFHDLDIVCWKGNPYITEVMPAPDEKSTLQFRVGPKSFYQTNSKQAFELYKAAWRMANLQGTELVYDLYTGTGTIASFVSAYAKKVIGVEYVKAAIEDAKVNAALNGITNVDFFAGDMKDMLTAEFFKEHGRPDVILTDPPRAGMHEDVCNMLLQIESPKIVYVSCNPATQARDLKILAAKYTIVDVQPVDMFPHTMHVENVVSLRLH
jgi:23S rRNA (uracil1939-C5)-methyltransferase